MFSDILHSDSDLSLNLLQTLNDLMANEIQNKGDKVVHGYKTTFQIPIAEACSWDLDAMELSARITAEAIAGGIHWTYGLMVDILRYPRWGRVMEGAGKDPYLGSLIAEARVKGFQGNLVKTRGQLSIS